MTGFDPAPTEASAWTAPPAPRLGIEEEFALVVPRTLEPANADGLYRCIRELIDGKYGGAIEKAYLFQMVLARRT